MSSRRHRLTASKPASPSGDRLAILAPMNSQADRPNGLLKRLIPFISVPRCSPLSFRPRFCFGFLFFFSFQSYFLTPPFLPLHTPTPFPFPGRLSAPGLDLTLWISPCRCHPGPPHPAPTHHFFLIVPLKF